MFLPNFSNLIIKFFSHIGLYHKEEQMYTHTHIYIYKYNKYIYLKAKKVSLYNGPHINISKKNINIININDSINHCIN